MPARHLQAHAGGAAIERGQPRLGGLCGSSLVGVDMAVGVNRGQAVGRFVVVQLDHLQSAGLLILVLGFHCLLRAAVA